MSLAALPDSYLIRRKVLSILGAKFHVFDASERVLAFSHQKAFKLKEDIRLYTDESMRQELLLIRARAIIDFSAAYDVVDSATQQKLGAMRRKGWSSFMRDAWEFLDANDRVVATLQEDSMGMAILRRFINLIPQKFHAEAGGRSLASYHQRFNPFVFKLDVRVEPAGRNALDPRMFLAAGILLAAVEGRQRN